MKRTIGQILCALTLATILLYGPAVRGAESPPDLPSLIEIGQVLPGFDLESLDGTPLNPESLRGKAPLVLIFFRGTW